ncbi:MAG: DNA/RNA non-specific endonuclease [Thermonemataceae bacterium]|nr:DNA/RNA non-specific endonuclease [Thermonemataceae bacterium]
MLKKLKMYSGRIFVLGGVSLMLVYIFASNHTLKIFFRGIESVLPHQQVTKKLYQWKTAYFSAEDSKQKTQQEIEKEFEIDTKKTDKQTSIEGIEIPKSSFSDEIIQHSYYTLAYSEEHEQARWVAYKLSKKNLSHKVTRRNEHFEPDPKVSTGSAIPADYGGSGYDRGHLAPAGDFTANETMMKETFFMSNMSPQKPLCNRETWRLLEEQVRRWAEKKGEIYVITGPVFAEKMPHIGKKNKIAVPPAYFKIIYEPAQKKAIAFIVPNINKKEDYKTYQVKVDEVEKATQLDFLHLLSDELEQKIEAEKVGKF